MWVCCWACLEPTPTPEHPNFRLVLKTNRNQSGFMRHLLMAHFTLPALRRQWAVYEAGQPLSRSRKRSPLRPGPRALHWASSPCRSRKRLRGARFAPHSPQLPCTGRACRLRAFSRTLSTWVASLHLHQVFLKKRTKYRDYRWAYLTALAFVAEAVFLSPIRTSTSSGPLSVIDVTHAKYNDDKIADD